MFVCDKCGLCCRKVSENAIYAELDRGDGICKFFDEMSKLCTIYEDRPLLCNVSKSYELIFQGIISREEYEERNQESCRKLKADAGLKK